MPRLHQTLLIPGEVITRTEALLTSGLPQPQADPDAALATFEAPFRDGYRLVVLVENTTPPQLVARLYNQRSELVDDLAVTGHIDQDYHLAEGDNSYEVTIVRAAHTSLTPETVAAYNTNPNRCPACHSEDIHAARPQVDGTTAWVRVECCACNARWKDLYNFAGISTDPEDWDPPEQNVARQT